MQPSPVVTSGGSSSIGGKTESEDVGGHSRRGSVAFFFVCHCHHKICYLRGQGLRIELLGWDGAGDNVVSTRQVNLNRSWADVGIGKGASGDEHPE
jgi:hypothetical protein